MEGSRAGDLAASDVWTVVKSSLWTLAVAAAAAALTALIDGVLPDLHNKGLIDTTLFALLTTVLHAIRKAVTTWLTDTRPIVVLFIACCLGLANSASAEDVTVRLTGVTRGQSYELAYGADGTIGLRLIQTVAVGGVPTPNPLPVPNPTPVPNSLAAQVQTLTAAALAEGGSHHTAANLVAVYSVVANQLNADALTLAQVAPALKSLSDSMIPTAEAAKWTKWRTSMGDLLTTRLGDKVTAVTTLRSIETGIKNAVDASAASLGSAKAIDWQKWLEILMPIILKLIEQLFGKTM